MLEPVEVVQVYRELIVGRLLWSASVAARFVVVESFAAHSQQKIRALRISAARSNEILEFA